MSNSQYDVERGYNSDDSGDIDECGEIDDISTGDYTIHKKLKLLLG